MSFTSTYENKLEGVSFPQSLRGMMERISLLRALKMEFRFATKVHYIKLLIEGNNSYLSDLFGKILNETNQHSLELTRLYRWQTGEVLPAIRELLDESEYESPDGEIYSCVNVHNALTASIRLAKLAQDFYGQEALRVVDKDLKITYKRLMELKANQVRSLQAQYDKVKSL